MLFASFSNFFFFPLLRLIYSHFAGSPMTTVRRARRSAFFLLSVANAVNQSNRELTAAAPPPQTLSHFERGYKGWCFIYSADGLASFFSPAELPRISSLSTRLPDDEIFRFCCRPFFPVPLLLLAHSRSQPAGESKPLSLLIRKVTETLVSSLI